MDLAQARQPQGGALQCSVRNRPRLHRRPVFAAARDLGPNAMRGVSTRTEGCAHEARPPRTDDRSDLRWGGRAVPPPSPHANNTLSGPSVLVLRHQAHSPSFLQPNTAKGSCRQHEVSLPLGKRARAGGGRRGWLGLGLPWAVQLLAWARAKAERTGGAGGCVWLGVVGMGCMDRLGWVCGCKLMLFEICG